MSFRALLSSTLRTPSVLSLLILLGALEIYTHVILAAFLTTQETLQAKAVADNSPERQAAEAAIATEKARTEREIALWSARKESAVARRATAEARKAASDAIVQKYVAINSPLRAKADAEAQEQEARLNEQLAQVEHGRALASARKERAEADVREEEAIKKQLQSQILDSFKPMFRR